MRLVLVAAIALALVATRVAATTEEDEHADAVAAAAESVHEDVAASVEDEDEEVVPGEEAASQAPPQLTPEQQRMQQLLQRQMMRYINDNAECAPELRALWALSREEQMKRQAAGTLKLSTECETEVNGLAAEFQAKLQSGEIQADVSEEGAEDYDGGDEEAPAAPAAPEDERSSMPIFAAVMLALLGIVAAALFVAQRRNAAFAEYLEKNPAFKAKYEAKNKAKAREPVE